MPERSITTEPAISPTSTDAWLATDLPIGPSDLDELARWIPRKEMLLLVELFERARDDPELARPALLLYSAYGERIARMLDQDPFPKVTQSIARRLQQLRAATGL
jgi:hypothetical protein